MFGEERQSEELKAFEAALAALRPRADGLDPRWRFLLAQEARLNENLPGSEALPAGQFLCSRCGAVLSGGRRKGRWAWPAAFSAMTAVAAVLLAALVIRAEPRTAAPASGAGRTSIATSSAQRKVDPGPALAVRDIPQRSAVSAETAYLNLRDHVLQFGIESWKPPAPAVAASMNAAEPILSCREQLDLLWAGEGGS